MGRYITAISVRGFRFSDGLISWILPAFVEAILFACGFHKKFSKLAVRRAWNKKFLEIFIYILNTSIYLYILYIYMFIYILFLKCSWNIAKFLVSCSPNGHVWKILRNPQKMASLNAGEIPENKATHFFVGQIFIWKFSTKRNKT